jgi:hypothetical protein
MIEDALVARLLAQNAITTLVGTRIYPLLAPQGAAAPYLIYQRISGERVRNFDESNQSAQPRIQIDAYAETYTVARQLAAAVRAALHGFAGTVSDSESPARFSPVRIQASALIDDRDLIDETANPKLYRRSADYLVMHVED